MVFSYFQTSSWGCLRLPRLPSLCVSASMFMSLLRVSKKKPCLFFLVPVPFPRVFADIWRSSDPLCPKMHFYEAHALHFLWRRGEAKGLLSLLSILLPCRERQTHGGNRLYSPSLLFRLRCLADRHFRCPDLFWQLFRALCSHRAACL